MVWRRADEDGLMRLMVVLDSIVVSSTHRSHAQLGIGRVLTVTTTTANSRASLASFHRFIRLSDIEDTRRLSSNTGVQS